MDWYFGEGMEINSACEKVTKRMCVHTIFKEYFDIPFFLFILTSILVLDTPNAGQKMLFSLYKSTQTLVKIHKKTD